MSDQTASPDETVEDWGVIRPDGVWVPMRPEEGNTSRQVAEDWAAYYPWLRPARFPW